MPQKPARALRRGDIIRYEGAQGAVIEEVVRDVQMILVMANGENVPSDTTKQFEVIPPEDVNVNGEPEPDPAITGEETNGSATTRRDL